MRNHFLALTLLSAAPGIAHAESAEQAFQGAKKAYATLKKDPAQRRRRDAWQKVAHRFELVAQKHPKSPQAAEALFTAGQLLGELSRISAVSEDLDSSVQDYQRLLTLYPHHRVADDAALALAHAQLDRLSEPDAARKTLQRAIRTKAHGEHALRLEALLASIPASELAKHPSVLARKTETAPNVSVKPSPEKQENGAIADRDGAVDAQDSDGDSDQADHAPDPEPSRERSSPPVSSAKEPALAIRGASVPLKPVTPAVEKERLKQLSHHPDEGVPLGQQLGLKVRRVVIDPGHGGHDSGTVGPAGTKEKDVALSISRKLAKDLEAQGLEVVLTRDDDHFVRLEDRAKLANNTRGDLFISIHCNSAPQKYLRGIETYTLNTASDRYSIRLAARENSSTERGVSDLQFILADLATKANTEESNRLAEHVQKGLVNRLSGKYAAIRDLGNKQALFYVLLGARMPAILVETAFLSNSEDEKRLSDKGYQDDVARAIASGVQDFLGYRERLAKMD
jgi:N-acetylmuramoyl-L-alanine amidase